MVHQHKSKQNRPIIAELITKMLPRSPVLQTNKPLSRALTSSPSNGSHFGDSTIFREANSNHLQSISNQRVQATNPLKHPSSFEHFPESSRCPTKHTYKKVPDSTSLNPGGKKQPTNWDHNEHIAMESIRPNDFDCGFHHQNDGFC